MTKIFISEKFYEEKIYIIETIFNDFLGIKCEIAISQSSNYLIITDGLKEIEFEDNFFENIDNSYLNIKYLPKNIIFSKNQFTSENDIPIIYGNDKIVISKNKIFSGIDIFASSFFMLTRWEENVTIEKDIHNRFPDKLSTAQKFGFHYRAIVNEYVEMLRNMFKHLGIAIENKRKFTITPTHDIDSFEKYSKISKFIKAFSGDILKRKNIKLAFTTIKEYTNIKINNQKDPYNVFDYFMEISEKYNLKSHFYFIASIDNEEFSTYNIENEKVRKTINKILDKNHIIGIHGSYLSYNQEDKYKCEKKRLEFNNTKITESRQHFLRFENPRTWQILENLGIKIDTTISFSNDGGFRSGTCYEYPVFDILNRKKLQLIEMPLIAMEAALKLKYNKPEVFFSKFMELKKITEKYNGNFIFLWHNSNYNISEWREYSKFYEKLFE